MRLGGGGKKKEGNRVLAWWGANASKMVNQLYDYVIEGGAPLGPRPTERRLHGWAEIKAAISLVDSLAALIGGPL